MYPVISRSLPRILCYWCFCCDAQYSLISTHIHSTTAYSGKGRLHTNYHNICTQIRYLKYIHTQYTIQWYSSTAAVFSLLRILNKNFDMENSPYDWCPTWRHWAEVHLPKNTQNIPNQLIFYMIFLSINFSTPDIRNFLLSISDFVNCTFCISE